MGAGIDPRETPKAVGPLPAIRDPLVVTQASVGGWLQLQPVTRARACGKFPFSSVVLLQTLPVIIQALGARIYGLTAPG